MPTTSRTPGQWYQAAQGKLTAEGRGTHSDLPLSITTVGSLPRVLWGVPSTPCQPKDPPARSLSAPGSPPWSQKQRQPLPARLAPLGTAACHLTPFHWPSFRRYCTEDSPSFPRPSLLESHISLMHGIRNPDLSQTSKVRPPGGHSPQVSAGPLSARAACSVGPGAGGEGHRAPVGHCGRVSPL